jgi:hypothetical protein
MMIHDNYDSIVKHPFVDDILKRGMEVSKAIEKPNGFKVGKKFSRTPMEHEYYCLEIGFCLSHLLSVMQQMEHSILFMSNFSPSETMKKAGVTRSNHLLWSVENYIIRTQTVYDRLLVLVDRLFNIQNQANRISHESIVTNVHIARSEIPIYLKPVKNSVKKYYRDRNAIIHEYSLIDEELRRIEAYSILTSNPDYPDYKNKNLSEDLKWHIREFVKKRKREFSRINKKMFESIANLFFEMHPIFLKKLKELEEK